MIERTIVGFLFALAVGTSAAQNNLDPSAIPDPDPLLQEASFQLAEGLEINLFAADPMLAKPIQMNWDAQGRLWVVSSRLYPHIKPGERSDDQVIVLEDTDNDGTADKSTVFAENLLIPTALMPGDGGVYVANSTEILFLEDTDGDLREDKRTVLLSGFGTEDTHHLIHTFRGGPDGMLYFNQSIYIHSHVETPRGIRRLMGGGIWHYRPETRELEVFCKGFVNSWGHIFDRWGQSFATDGAFGEGINYVFPGSVWVTSPDAKRIMKGLNPGQPKHCALEVVSGGHFPDDWNGSLVTNDFRGHRVNRFVVSEDGSGYASRQVEDVVRTSHAAFRPIDVRIGPDGALYIADWYNPIIQHGEVDFRDPRRDHTHGRIWRVTHKGRPLIEKPKIVEANVAALLEHLKSPEDWTRHFAKRELRTRDEAEVIRGLQGAVKRIDRGVESEQHQLLEALWAFQSVNHLEEPLLRELLKHKDQRIRAAAVRVLYHWHSRVADGLQLLTNAVKDQHPQVRLEAVNALRQVGTAGAIEAAFVALKRQPLDANLDFALWLTARETKDVWLPAYQKGEINVGDASAVAFVLKATEDPAALKPLMDAFATGEASEWNEREETVNLIADIGGPDALRFLFDYAMKEEMKPLERATILRALAHASDQRGVKPAGDGHDAIVELIKEGSGKGLGKDDVAGAAAKLAGSWKMKSATPRLIALVESGRESWPAMIEALNALAALGGEDNLKRLETVIRDGSSSGMEVQIKCAAIVALASADLNRAATAAAGFLETKEESFAYNGRVTDGPLVSGAFRAFTFRKGGADALATAVGGKTLHSRDASEGVRIAESSPDRSQKLIDVLITAGGLTPIVQSLSPEEMKAMMGLVQREGDAARGEAIYRRQQLLCTTCHAIGGAGGVIGPDMISLGASAPVDYIIDSLLEPNKKIKEGYHMTMVTQKNGEIAAGSVVREDGTEVVLRDAIGNEIRVPTDAIASREVSPVSMMPAGLTASLRKDEFVDLVKFMSMLGKEDGLRVTPQRLVRRWRSIGYHEPLSQAIRRKGLTESILADPELPWLPAYSRVDGTLPMAELGENFGFNGSKLSVVKFEIDVTTLGVVKFQLRSPESLQLRIGKKMIDPRLGEVELEVGRHAVVVIVDRVARGDQPLLVELLDADGSKAQARLVSGM
ncbi:MAG: putative heme-binding domain-containing protein [Verrucomicrobiales bacterium]|jgi:putative heme-binding domain-containing protein